jgi:hypothetical protein
MIPPIDDHLATQGTLQSRMAVGISLEVFMGNIELNGCPASHVATPEATLWLFNNIQHSHGRDCPFIDDLYPLVN